MAIRREGSYPSIAMSDGNTSTPKTPPGVRMISMQCRYNREAAQRTAMPRADQPRTRRSKIQLNGTRYSGTNPTTINIFYNNQILCGQQDLDGPRVCFAGAQASY